MAARPPPETARRTYSRGVPSRCIVPVALQFGRLPCCLRNPRHDRTRNDRPRPLSSPPRLDQDDHLWHGALLQNCANGFEVVLEREGCWWACCVLGEKLDAILGHVASWGDRFPHGE